MRSRLLGVAGIVLGLLAVAGITAITQTLLDTSNTVDENQRTARVAARESAEREDQFCLLAERSHRDVVRQLKNTYDYLLSLRGRDLDSPLNAFVIRNLSRVEREARRDQAPPFCDERGKFGDKNVGLPEPDPAIPERPARVDRLLPEPQR